MDIEFLKFRTEYKKALKLVELGLWNELKKIENIDIRRIILCYQYKHTIKNKLQAFYKNEKKKFYSMIEDV